jgi:hypothetical protein
LAPGTDASGSGEKRTSFSPQDLRGGVALQPGPDTITISVLGKDGRPADPKPNKATKAGGSGDATGAGGAGSGGDADPGTIETMAPAIDVDGQLQPDADDGALSNLAWGAAAYRHGTPIQLGVDAANAEGRIVYFDVEKDSGGGNWVLAVQAQGTVNGGRAVAMVTIPDNDAPSTGGGAPKKDTCQFRFHVSFTPAASSGGGSGASSGS